MRRPTCPGIIRKTAAAAAAGLLMLASLQGCTTNPATGEQDFTPFMSPADEVKVGAQQHPQMVAEFGGAYPDPAIQSYVDGLGQKLAAQSELPDLKWTFTVLDSEIVNAFALPGGYVYISRGLMGLADTEDQLAGVIGHEIGHVTARHAAKRYSAAVGAQAGAAGASILADIFLGRGSGQLVGEAAGSFAQMALASYSRGQELQSDSLGVRYLARSGYHTPAMSEFLAKMGRESELLAKLTDQAPRGFSYLDTHPPTEERVVEAKAAADAKGTTAPSGTRRDYITKIDGLIYGDSPEQGFRRGRSFLHPGLRLAFEVPADFHMMNSTKSVNARGPQGASIIFDRADTKYEGSPQVYLSNVWAAKLGLRTTDAFTANGLKGATGAGQVKLQNGATAWLRLGVVQWPDGTMYRFQFLAPDGMSGTLDPAFMDTLQSFRQLSVREAKNLKPLRITAYQVRKGDTVAKVAARLPLDKLAEDRLRVLNGIGPQEELTPGDWIKIVVER